MVYDHFHIAVGCSCIHEVVYHSAVACGAFPCEDAGRYEYPRAMANCCNEFVRPMQCSNGAEEMRVLSQTIRALGSARNDDSIYGFCTQCIEVGGSLDRKAELSDDSLLCIRREVYLVSRLEEAEVRIEYFLIPKFIGDGNDDVFGHRMRAVGLWGAVPLELVEDPISHENTTSH